MPLAAPVMTATLSLDDGSLPSDGGSCSSRGSRARRGRARASGRQGCEAETTSSTGSSATGAKACASASAPPGPVHAPFRSTSFKLISTSSQIRARAVDMRDDLQQEIRRPRATLDRRRDRRLVLVAHRAGGDAHRAVVERADQRVDLDPQLGLASFFGNPRVRARPRSAARRPGTSNGYSCLAAASKTGMTWPVSVYSPKPVESGMRMNS